MSNESAMTSVHGTVIHGTAVAISGRAVLLTGPPGSGKTELALLLIDRGARLIADDLVGIAISATTPGMLLISLPLATAMGPRQPRLALRHFGIVEVPYEDQPMPLSLVAELGVEGLADRQSLQPMLSHYGPIEGLFVPKLVINPASPATAIKVELALDRWGL